MATDKKPLPPAFVKGKKNAAAAKAKKGLKGKAADKGKGKGKY